MLRGEFLFVSYCPENRKNFLIVGEIKIEIPKYDFVLRPDSE